MDASARGVLLLLCSLRRCTQQRVIHGHKRASKRDTRPASRLCDFRVGTDRNQSQGVRWTHDAARLPSLLVVSERAREIWSKPSPQPFSFARGQTAHSSAVASGGSGGCHRRSSGGRLISSSRKDEEGPHAFVVVLSSSTGCVPSLAAATVLHVSSQDIRRLNGALCYSIELFVQYCTRSEQSSRERRTSFRPVHY